MIARDFPFKRSQNIILPFDANNFTKFNLNYQDFSFPRRFSWRFIQKTRFAGPRLLESPAWVQTLTAILFIKSSFSAIVSISHIQSVSVSSVWFSQEFHKTEISIPTPLPSEISHNERDLLLWLRFWRAFLALFAVTSLWWAWAVPNASGSCQYYMPSQTVAV